MGLECDDVKFRRSVFVSENWKMNRKIRCHESREIIFILSIEATILFGLNAGLINKSNRIFNNRDGFCIFYTVEGVMVTDHS